MKILVINSGSSSLKYKLFDMEGEKELAAGLIEKIGESEGHAVLKAATTIEHHDSVADHAAACTLMTEDLIASGVIDSLENVDAVGHRVVHGGEKFSDPTRIDDTVAATIEALIPLAPLHNPANLTGIKAAMKAAPGIPHVAVFDTAFHQSMPKHAYLYALPHELYETLGIRRYGFHGTSHRFIAKEAARFLGRPLEDLNMITLHLGNGDSAAAIQKGKSIDTSMGMTPLEGLIMGSRSGDVDPEIIFFLMNKLDKTPDEIDRMLNKESGLKGICGVNDMREIIANAKAGDEWADLAVKMFVYRVKKYIGAYGAILGHLDCVVFTGGIGEHSAHVRQLVCEGMETIPGIIIDPKLNEKADEETTLISRPESPVRVVVVPTNEELEIARETRTLLD
jgi:acetate kinase